MKRRNRWIALGLSLGLVAAMAVPVVAGPDKVIKSTGKDAATMSAVKVQSWGGVYLNSCVENAIADGYKGKVNMIQPAGNVDIILGMSFGNLDLGSYTVFIDRNGGAPGPWTAEGTFVADEFGSGEFNYNLPAGSLAAGDYDWAIWVNGPAGSCGSILQTDDDLEFTIGV
ncbi:MAG: hypothetical protein U9O18_08185 [Chloroflexota bacterium]|nr:hypothetical protein [Chloroflexota bacterium]